MIAVERLGKRFGHTVAVDEISFHVPEGQVLGVLGPNGAGKSTTMRMITGFLPPDGGTVEVAGRSLDRQPLELRRAIGYLPENVALYPELRVREYLDFRAALEGVPRRGRRAAVSEIAGRCLVEDVLERVIGTLSKGYRQRVGLAGALVHRPPVVILDEPTIGLDPHQIIRIRELITELGRDHTVLLSTHILPEVEQICDRVLIVDRGRIVADDSPQALRSTGVADHLVCELSGAGSAGAGALERVAGVAAVVPLGDDRFRVALAPGADPRRELFRLAVDRGWPLVELSPEQATLEEVFVRLTTHDAAGDPASGTPVPVVAGEAV